MILLSAKEVFADDSIKTADAGRSQIRNYSPSTVRCYVRSVADFAKHFKRSPDQLGSEEIRSWQLYLLRDKGVKISSYIQSVCGLRFFYTNTLNRKVEIERIPLPRYEKKLPVILSKERSKRCLRLPGTSAIALCWPRCTVAA